MKIKKSLIVLAFIALPLLSSDKNNNPHKRLFSSIEEEKENDIGITFKASQKK